MAFSENLQTLYSILSSDFLIESRYDIMSGFDTLNTYALTSKAGLIQTAPVDEINNGDGYGAITPIFLSNEDIALKYHIKYDTSFVTIASLVDSSGSFASVEYVDHYIAENVYNPLPLYNDFLSKTETTTHTGDDGEYNLGSPTSRWGEVHAMFFKGEATTALYGDLAEKYKCSEEVEYGDIISIYTGDGEYDVQKSQVECDYTTIGVVSEKPGYIMSSATDGPAVGLIGKLPVKIVGFCKKGDALVTSNISGVARAIKDPSEHQFKIGFTLESKDYEGVGLVSSIIK